MQKKNSPKETFGKRIRQLRREREWSQEDLGKKINIHWQTVALYEKDDTIPSAMVLKRIAEALGVTADYLLFGATDSPLSKIKNKELLKRIEQLDRVNPDDIKSLLDVMDVYIQKSAVREAVAVE